jgi:hypothetical protein
VNRNRQLRPGERGPDVRCHVIRALGGVAVQASVFRDQAGEEIGEIGDDVGIGVLLNQQRSRGVLAEDCKQPGLGVMAAKPRFDFPGELVQSFAARRDVNPMGELLQSALLFDGHALGEIARLIHIATPAYGNVIREELQRHDLEDWQQQFGGRWNCNGVIGDF